jgi:molybdopterin/thiamine biosynthesis adenylyltransferase
LPSFIGLTQPAGPRLDGLRVMLIGCGSVGAPVALHLARLQVGEILIVDPGRLKPESLLTHPIDPGAIGRNKADHFGRLAKAISPCTRVCAFAGPVQALSLSALARADVVVMATDNLAAEIEVGQRCIYHRKPLLQASVHGDTLVAQVRLWLNRDGSGPCPACSFGAGEWDHVNRETTFSCGGNGARPERHLQTAPTMSVSFLCALSAEMAMTQLLRHVLRLGPPLDDSLIQWCGYKYQMSSSPLERNPACPCEHVAWDRVSLPDRVARSSLRDIARTAGFQEADLTGEFSFLVDELTYVDQVACCSSPQPVRRFSQAGGELGKCCRCGSALHPQLYYSYRPTPVAVLSGRIDQPLEQLGAGAAEWVVLHGNGRNVFCHEEV